MNTIHTKNIIYIEDREEDIKLVRRIVEKEFKNVNLSVLSDSEKVLNDIENGSFMSLAPHFLLVDIKMPKVSGFDILKALKRDKTYKHIPRVVFSSSSQKSDISVAYTLNCNSYIEKPKTYSKLKETLVSTFDYWLEYNKN